MSGLFSSSTIVPFSVIKDYYTVFIERCFRCTHTRLNTATCCLERGQSSLPKINVILEVEQVQGKITQACQ